MASFNERLIGKIECYPILYDSTLPEFKNSYAKNQIWEEIGETVGMTGDEVKRKWKNLKESYSKYLKCHYFGDTRKDRYGKWQWASQMDFMKNHLNNALSSKYNDASDANNDRHGDISDSSLHSGHDVDVVEKKIHITSHLDVGNSDSTACSPTPKRKKISNVGDESSKVNEVNNLTSTELIMLGYARVMDGLSKQRLIETKMKIAQILMQAELEEEAERNLKEDPEVNQQTTDYVTESEFDITIVKTELE